MPDDNAKLKRLRRRDKAMWPFYESYINAAVHDLNDDTLLEGNVWPDYIKGSKLQFRVVFLVDTSAPEVQAAHLKAVRDSPHTANNWMRDWSDERLETWAHFNLLRSQLYVELCQKHTYKYFDISYGGIQRTQDQAFEYLLFKGV